MPDVSLPNVGKVESLGLLFSLLPGFLVIVIVRFLTARGRKLDAVEAILHGLAYTLLVHAVWAVLTLKSWLPTPQILGLSLCSIAIALFIARFHVLGWTYRILRNCGLTEECDWESPWETAFRSARRAGLEYAILHLKDRRRIMGAVRMYPWERAAGHVAIENSQWLGTASEAIDAPGLILIDAQDIAFVQFLPSDNNRIENVETKPAPTASSAPRRRSRKSSRRKGNS